MTVLPETADRIRLTGPAATNLFFNRVVPGGVTYPQGIAGSSVCRASPVTYSDFKLGRKVELPIVGRIWAGQGMCLVTFEIRLSARIVLVRAGSSRRNLLQPSAKQCFRHAWRRCPIRYRTSTAG